MAEVLSSLALCTGLGDCINSRVNYGLKPQYFNLTSTDFSLYLIRGGLRKVIGPLLASVPRAVKEKETLSLPQEGGEGDLQ